MRKWNAEKEDAEYEAFRQHHQYHKRCNQLTKQQCINRRHSLFDLSGNERFAFQIGFLINAFLRDKTDDDLREARYQFSHGFELCRGGFKYVNNVRDSRLKRLRDCVKNGGFQLPKHSHSGGKSNNMMRPEKSLWIVNFLLEKASWFGLPVPTPTRAAIQLPSIYLPSDFSITSLFDMFCTEL